MEDIVFFPNKNCPSQLIFFFFFFALWDRSRAIKFFFMVLPCKKKKKINLSLFYVVPIKMFHLPWGVENQTFF